MGRIKGRFYTNDYELKRMNRDIRQEQKYHGTSVKWWFYEGADPNDTYDEGGRRWRGPVVIPVVSAVPAQGANVPDPSGQFITDTVVLRMSYRQAVDKGLKPNEGDNLSEDFAERYGDRFIYRDHVYSVEAIRLDGHFDAAGRDVMILVSGGQLRRDEFYDDVDFFA